MKTTTKRKTAYLSMAPLLAAAVLMPATSALADDPAEESVTAEAPDADDIDLSDLPDANYEVTADWGDGKVITDATEGDDGTGDGDGDPVEPDPKADSKADADKDGSADAKGDDGDKAKSGDADAKGDEPEEKCDVDASETKAEKVVLVDGSGGANATVQTCEKTDDGYTEVKSYDGKVGYAGISAPGAKVEGDGKTPSGTWALEEGFGINDRPKQFPSNQDWQKTTKDDVWIDGDASVDEGYNTAGKISNGDKGESMAQDPAYRYAQVVDYNRNPVKAGEGSAIFLHVHTGSGKTAGCVSLSEKELLEVFAWEGDDATDIQITQ